MRKMNRWIRMVVTVWAIAGSLSVFAPRAEPIVAAPTSSDKTKPANPTAEAMRILGKNCLSCHNDEKKKGGLTLSSREALLQGGDNGTVLAPGKASESRLAAVLLPDADPHMPPKKQLTDQQIETLRTWINQGANWNSEALDESPVLLDPNKLQPWSSAYQPALAIALSPDGKQLAVARGREVLIYETGQTNQSVAGTLDGHRDIVQSLAWSPDGQWLASGEFRRVLLWDAKTLKQSLQITNFAGRITALDFTPDSTALAIADGAETQSGWVHLWRLADGEIKLSWIAHGDSILDIKASPDGNLLATASVDKLVKLWELPSGQERAKLEGHTGHVLALAFKHDSALLASAGADKEIKIWDIKTKEQKITIERHPAAVTDLAWTADGKAIFSACEDGVVRLCEEAKDHPSKTYSGANDMLYAVAASADGKTVYGAGFNGSARVWNASGKIEREWPAAATAATPTTSETPLSFVNDVLPILSKAGCNAGKCHAKQDGQNGFKLSVFAYDPNSDFKEILKDARGRRVFPAFPEESLLLKKPAMAVPHEGGERFAVDSKTYVTLLRWIEQGMPYSQPNEPTLTNIEVSPADAQYRKEARQSLVVKARYSNGNVRDVTDLAEYDSNDKEIAEVSENGEVKVGKLSGETAVIARFMGMVAVSRITVPADRVLADALYTSLPVNNFIDELAYVRFKKLGLLPSDRCTDSEFLRRASLDTIGVLPSPEEARKFLDDTDAEKRNKLIDRLLEKPAWGDYWANKWADLLRPNPDRVGVKSVFMLDQWLRESFHQNKPYDQLARDIITAQGSTHKYGPAVVFRDRREPADISTLVSQIFLGVRLECAKCHHHPNEKWSQEDFYQFAAYFAEIKRKGTGISPPISGDAEVLFHTPGGDVKHPITQAVLKPKPPDGPLAQLEAGRDPRGALADWVCDSKNPFFARAVANRVWAEFMGRGLVDPVDDFRASNPASNEPLLDALAQDFVRHGYNLKHLMRTILRSHIYQLSSLPNEHNARDTRNFSRSHRRRLPAEVLLDAVIDVTGAPTTFQGTPAGARAIATWNYKISSEFMDAFGRPNSSSDCPCERDAKPSVVQALHLMNSNDLQNKIAFPEGRAKRLASSERPTKEIITELYLACYNRYPTPEELSLASRAFATAEATRQSATEDIMWALINSAEFVFNH
ncbi:MAG: DUF1553 domain-containing protein [Verrucomicrobia bacterium]|nr:DUF1553 domain-containing protein [Verrucomicrobiota bacterium]